MAIIKISYSIRLQGGKKIDFDLQMDDKTQIAVNMTPKNPPGWATLGFHQCGNCTLNLKDHKYCPAALNLVQLIDKCQDLGSFEKVRVEVKTPDRNYIVEAPAQKVLSSLVGLIMATSGCPHTKVFKPMVRFHLPLATDEEDLYRVSAMFMLAQYFLHKQDREIDVDLEGLSEVYRELQIVNKAMTERLSAADDKETAKSAILRLHLFSHMMPYNIKDSLDKIQYLFDRTLFEK